jgi:hypothetical protein
MARRRPGRQFAPALRALARAHAGTSQASLTQEAHSLLSVLTWQPLIYFPAVAATASRLRRRLDPDRRPALPEQASGTPLPHGSWIPGTMWL